MNTIFKLVVTAAMTSVATTVAAADFTRTSVARVSYADLDLSNPAGMKALTHRVHIAADRVCDVHPGTDLAHHIQARDCHNAAFTAAMGSFKTANPVYAAR